MSSKNELTGKEVKNATTTATHAAAVVTVTSPSVSANQTIYIAGILLSSSGTIAAAVAVTLSGIDGGTLTIQLPAAAVAPVVLLFGVHPLRAIPGTNAVLTLPDLGAAILGTATLLYYIGAS